MKKRTKITIAVAAIVLVILAAAIICFGSLLKTVLTLKPDAKNGIYEIDYSIDYKLDELLEQGGVSNEEELVQYIIKTLLKGLPVPVKYKVPKLGCSTFIAEKPDQGYIFGRNLDNQTTDLAIVKTAPQNGYKSVSVVNLSFLSYNEKLTPESLFNRVNAMAAPYFPLDGVNEKGLAVGVLQLQAPPTDQDTEKVDVGTTLALRILLDKTANVKEAVEMLATLDMHASAKGCYHIHIADAEGNSVVVSYVDNKMVVTEKEGKYQAATNFYLHDVPFKYEKRGIERYNGLIETLQEKDGILTVEEGMKLLNKVSIIKTEPDKEGRVYSTQWSAVYDLSACTLTLCPDRNYKKTFTYSVD